MYDLEVTSHISCTIVIIPVTEPTRREASGSICKAFIQGRGHKTSKVHAMANRYNTGKTKSNPRASVGLRSVNNIQQGKA